MARPPRRRARRHRRSSSASAPSATSSRRPETGALVGTLLVSSSSSPSSAEQQFLSTGGTASWLNIAAELAIIALPVGLLMIAGEFDLSVGSVVAASSVTLAIVSGTLGLPMIVGIFAALVRRRRSSASSTAGSSSPHERSVVHRDARDAIRSRRPHARPRPRSSRAARASRITPDPISKAIFGTLIAGQFEVAIFWAIGIAARRRLDPPDDQVRQLDLRHRRRRRRAPAPPASRSEGQDRPVHGHRRSEPRSSASSRRCSTTELRPASDSRSSSTRSSRSSSVAFCSPVGTAR